MANIFSGSAPISYVGATPVFADVDARTWCLSAEALEACITPRTKAAVVVDLYGNIPDMDALRSVAQCHGIALIEDAAQAIATEYRGRKAGAFGVTGVLQFHGSKTLTTGEGGLLATDREDLFRRAQILRDHGRRPGDKRFYNAEVGYKYKMSSMQAALGLAQLERIGELIERKRRIFDWYRQGLDDLDGVTLNFEAPGTFNTYWMATVILDPKFGLDKEQCIELLAKRRMDSRPYFYPLSSLPAYAHLPGVASARARNVTSYRLSPYGVNLPSALQLTEQNVRDVCRALREILSAGRRA